MDEWRPIMEGLNAGLHAAASLSARVHRADSGSPAYTRPRAVTGISKTERVSDYHTGIDSAEH